MATERDDRWGSAMGDAAGGDGGLASVPAWAPPAGERTAAPASAFAPVLPPREPAAPRDLVDRHADGPTVSAASDPSDPSAAWASDGSAGTPGRAAGSARGRRRSPSVGRRIVGWTAALLAIALGGTLVVVFAQGSRDARELRSLPSFDGARPVAGTVVIEVEERLGSAASPFASTVTVNPASSDFRLDGSGDDVSIEMVRAAGSTYLFDGAAWLELDAAEAAQAAFDLAPMMRISMFTDYVPSAARPHVMVIEGDRTELRGRELRRLELLLDDEAFRRADRAAFDAWVEANGVANAEPNGRPFHLELWFDDEGVLWRIRSERADGPTGAIVEYVQFDLISFVDDGFSATPPSTEDRTVATGSASA